MEAQLTTIQKLMDSKIVFNISEVEYFTITYKRLYDNAIAEYIVRPFENYKTYFISYVRGHGVRRFNKNRVLGISVNLQLDTNRTYN